MIKIKITTNNKKELRMSTLLNTIVQAVNDSQSELTVKNVDHVNGVILLERTYRIPFVVGG